LGVLDIFHLGVHQKRNTHQCRWNCTKTRAGTQFFSG